MDWLSNIYLGCFIFGLIFTVAAFLVAAKEAPGWFNSLVVFLTWFGGIGFTLKLLRLSDLITPGLALLGGLAVSLSVRLLVARVGLPEGAALTDQEANSLAGTVARVSYSFDAKGQGEITFSKNGVRRSVPARSIDGHSFRPGSQVAIVSVENGLVLVDDLDRLLAEAGATRWSSTARS